MKSLRELERDLETLESQVSKHSLHVTLEDGRNLQLNFKSADASLMLLVSAIENGDHPYKPYIMQTVKGGPNEGQFALICKAIWESHARIAVEKAGI
ncbi:MAG TPA: hypothetical protein VGK06_08310 [Methanosarcina sp.]|jgi:hypothetical protein